MRLSTADTGIENLPGWLTTVTTRLCLDRLRAKRPMPEAETDLVETEPDPADQVALADTVVVALQVVLDRLTPNERVAFVLHDSFGIDFTTVAAILDTTPAASRKLASRARGKVAQPITQPAAQDQQPDWAVVDAFMAAAREGDFSQLMELLAPDAVLASDAAALALGTPSGMRGRTDVAAFFNGSAHAALPVFVKERPGVAWIHRGETKVAFDFTLQGGVVSRIDFRADPEALTQVAPRKGGDSQ